MYYQLRRHPIPVTAFFDHCLVLTYAAQASALQPLIPAGLTLDTHNGMGFIAAAFVQTRRLRPEVLPACCGQSFFLAGYRVFVKRRSNDGRTRRGLRILRSDTNKRAMVVGGNLLTHYNYHYCDAECVKHDNKLTVRVRTPRGAADADITARIDATPAELPAGSPFESVREARRFAGPLPYTFDYEPETNSLIRIKGERGDWNPVQVCVEVRELRFLPSLGLAEKGVKLAAAFHVADIPYRWQRGVVEPLNGEAA